MRYSEGQTVIYLPLNKKYRITKVDETKRKVWIEALEEVEFEMSKRIPSVLFEWIKPVVEEEE